MQRLRSRAVSHLQSRGVGGAGPAPWRQAPPPGDPVRPWAAEDKAPLAEAPLSAFRSGPRRSQHKPSCHRASEKSLPAGSRPLREVHLYSPLAKMSPFRRVGTSRAQGQFRLGLLGTWLLPQHKARPFPNVSGSVFGSPRLVGRNRPAHFRTEAWVVRAPLALVFRSLWPRILRPPAVPQLGSPRLQTEPHSWRPRPLSTSSPFSARATSPPLLLFRMWHRPPIEPVSHLVNAYSQSQRSHPLLSAPRAASPTQHPHEAPTLRQFRHSLLQRSRKPRTRPAGP